MQKQNLSKEERKIRVIARGEHSNHSHVIVGDAEVVVRDGKTYVTVNSDANAILRHLLESDWMAGREIWTGEHTDIKLAAGTYEFIQQSEYDPYEDAIRAVKD